MFMMSVLLSAVTFAPAMPPARRSAFAESGFISGDVISPDKTCKPGGICASTSLKNPVNGCYVNNFYNSTKGGTPLTIDVTESGKSGSPVYIYWVNATNKALAIKDKAYANIYCPT